MVEAETLKVIVSAPTFRKLPVMDLNGLENINVYRKWTDTLNRARDHYLKQGLPQSRRPLKFLTEGAGKLPRIDISDIVLQKMLNQVK